MTGRLDGRTSTRTAPGRLAGPCCLVLLTTLVWLILSAIVLRMTVAMAAVVFLLVASEQFLALAGSGLPLQRKLAGHALAAVLALFLTLLLATWRDQSLTADAGRRLRSGRARGGRGFAAALLPRHGAAR